MLVNQFVLLIQMLIYQICFADKIMQSRVVGGEFTSIKNHPYSAFLAIGRKHRFWSCGSSIINQRILLTAAHCLESCNQRNKCLILVSVGSSNKEVGEFYITHKFKSHEEYNRMTLDNDVALIFTEKNIELNKAVSKVILMNSPPNRNQAVVAGWGVTDEKGLKKSKWLKRVEQDIIASPKCNHILRGIPAGTVCGEKTNSEEYVAKGDSGSALVVENLIQIGLVSYRNPIISKSLVVYTDVPHFYHWIKHTAKEGYCKLYK